LYMLTHGADSIAMGNGHRHRLGTELASGIWGCDVMWHGASGRRSWNGMPGARQPGACVDRTGSYGYFFFISLPFRRRANCFGTVATSSAAISEEQEDTKEATPPSPANQPTLTLADP